MTNTGNKKGEAQSGLPGYVERLPPRLKRLLAQTLSRRSAGDTLSVTWYEFPTHSNFDRFPREAIREAAELDGLVVYSRGPHVTQKGVDWGKATFVAKSK